MGLDKIINMFIILWRRVGLKQNIMNSYKANLLHRLKIVRGHLDKVIQMVEVDRYCLDLIQQSQAVQSALAKIDELILENHLKTCVKDAMTSNHDVDNKVQEVMNVFKRRKYKKYE
jgi:DNA-binding FrmR family transcriptional regulator